MTFNRMHTIKAMIDAAMYIYGSKISVPSTSEDLNNDMDT
jgi:hypothetical protein